MRGLRKYLTPFAPDQSGAESVFYELGGIVVILDAGGCAGNICGFDEPRWSQTRSAVFSAGLRDMDAVMGRDRLLVKKIVSCVSRVDAKFVAIIGTPVPAVIGTDLQAVKRMLEKEIDLPIITTATDGMHLYDRGVSLAYQALLKEMYVRIAAADEETRPLSGRAGVFGVTPLDLPDASCADLIRRTLLAEGFEKVILYGSGADLEDYEEAGKNLVNIAASADGIAAVRFLQEKFGTPADIRFPGAGELLRRIAGGIFAGKKPEAGKGVPAAGPDSRAVKAEAGEGAPDAEGSAQGGCRRVLIVHGQVLANSLRDRILEHDPQAQVTVASWFYMEPSIAGKQDVSLKEEDDFTDLVEKIRPDLIIGDRVLKRMIPSYRGSFAHLLEFSVSGKREAAVYQ